MDTPTPQFAVQYQRKPRCRFVHEHWDVFDTFGVAVKEYIRMTGQPGWSGAIRLVNVSSGHVFFRYNRPWSHQ